MLHTSKGYSYNPICIAIYIENARYSSCVLRILKYYSKVADRNAITLVCYLAHTKTVIG